MELIARGLSHHFSRRPAVANANISLPSGRICGLVGPNGAGKTTLLLMLAGLLDPGTGTISLDEHTLDSRELRRLIGWMPDIFGTWDGLTAHEILTTFSQLYGQSTRQAHARADELLAWVHLEAAGSRPAHELSRGQKQRLGFARALVHRPKFLLLDEPASGMDPRSRIDLRDQLRELATQGCGVLVSSHILGELEDMVDDVIMMTDGQTHRRPPTEGRMWRVRELGNPDATTMLFHDDEAAANYLSECVAAGVRISEFRCVGSELETAYLALDPERR